MERLTRFLARRLDVPAVLVVTSRNGGPPETEPTLALTGFAAAASRLAEVRTIESCPFLRKFVLSGVDLNAEDLSLLEEARGCVLVKDHDVRAMASAPLRSRSGRSLGAICALHQSPRRWSAEELELLEIVAGSIAAGLELAVGPKAGAPEPGDLPELSDEPLPAGDTAGDLADRAAAALRESEERYRTFVAQISEGIWRIEFDPALPAGGDEEVWIDSFLHNGYIAECNDQLARMLGFGSSEDLTGVRLSSHFPPAEPRHRESVRAFARMGFRAAEVEADRVGSDGKPLHYVTNVIGIVEEGTLVQVWGTMRDVTDRTRAEAELQIQKIHLQKLFESAPEAIVVLDEKDRIMRANAEFTRMFGYTLREALGRAINELIAPPDMRDEAVSFTEVVARGEKLSVETVRCRKDGTRLDVSILGTPIRVGETGTQVYGIYRDITERKRMEERLVYDALHDVLTGLPNRALFMDRLGRVVAQSRVHGVHPFAVLFLDLDRFKVVNDSLGHLIGDDMLVEVARRMEGCLSEEETVARLGGDEFAILLPHIRGAEDAIRVASCIQDRLSPTFIHAGQELFTSASIGIALSFTGYDRPEDMLRDADTAMYRAKARGRACYEVFDRSMRTQALAQLQFDMDLRRALERDEFELFYQPIISLETGRLQSLEALLRWRHSQRGLVQPDEFIPLAEETGLIVPFGWWVIEEACRQLGSWRRLHPAAEDLRVTVNLSAAQFAQPELVERTTMLMEKQGLAAGALGLEITEGVIIRNPESAAGTLRAFKESGIQISIDDFGTGYSSLSYLHRFPVDILKVDRSFVSRITTGASNIEIVRAIVGLAHTLNMDVIAEGVETRDQLKSVQELGCDLGQGYLFSEPLPADAAGEVVESGAPLF